MSEDFKNNEKVSDFWQGKLTQEERLAMIDDPSMVASLLKVWGIVHRFEKRAPSLKCLSLRLKNWKSSWKEGDGICPRFDSVGCLAG